MWIKEDVNDLTVRVGGPPKDGREGRLDGLLAVVGILRRGRWGGLASVARDGMVVALGLVHGRGAVEVELVTGLVVGLQQASHSILSVVDGGHRRGTHGREVNDGVLNVGGWHAGKIDLGVCDEAVRSGPIAVVEMDLNRAAHAIVSLILEIHEMVELVELPVMYVIPVLIGQHRPVVCHCPSRAGNVPDVLSVLLRDPEHLNGLRLAAKKSVAVADGKGPPVRHTM